MVPHKIAVLCHAGIAFILAAFVFALADQASAASSCKFGKLRPEAKLCSKTLSGRANREVLVQMLLQDCSLFPLDYDLTGRVTYSEQAEAILGNIDYCTKDKCSKDTPDKLADAYGYLLSISEGTPISIGDNKISISLKARNSAAGRDLLRAFLQGPADAVDATCVAAANPNAPPPATKPTEQSSATSAFAIRKNVADLPISRDSPQFKGLDKGSFALNDDYMSAKLGVNVDLAAGYTFGPYALTTDQNSSLSFTPFVYYHQQYVAAQTASQDQKVFNVAGGLLSTWELFHLGIFQFSPKYVHAIHADADMESVNLVYTPPITIAGIGGATEVPYTDGSVYFRFSPQLQVSYGDVTKTSSELPLLPTGRFGWLGPSLALYLYGANTFEGWSYIVSYVYLSGFAGPYSNVKRWENTLNYSLSSNDMWSVQLKYIYGQDLDTLQMQKAVTIGVGFKY
jgi:hypothetical protein